MKKVVLPGTGFEISRLSFGTASLHHLLTSRARQRLLGSALDCGISHFDTSPFYGFGLAESALGALLGLGNQAITVATKVGIYAPRAAKVPIPVWLTKAAAKIVPILSRPEVDFSIARAESSLNESLKRLKRDCIDILFLHEPRATLINTEEFLTWESNLLSSGKVRHCGLAGTPELLTELLAVGSPLVDVLQVKDSLDKMEGDLILRSGRCLQITYGYFSAARRQDASVSAQQVLTTALGRNISGSVLFSTRDKDHLMALASIQEVVAG